MAAPAQDALADAAPEHGDAAQQALAVCVQQASFQVEQHDASLSVVCALLAASKRLAALVAQSCASTLALQARPDTAACAESLAAWLNRNGGLLGDLELFLRVLPRTTAVPPAGQQHPAERVLAQLPASLTRLALSSDFDDSGTLSVRQANALAAVLPGLTRLRALAFPDKWAACASLLVLPALAPLSRLTSLRLPVPSENAQLVQASRGVPAQLRELELTSTSMGAHNTSHHDWLALQHVSGLTRLCMLNVRVDGGVLPGGLCHLEVADVEDVAPLLALTALTELVVHRCSTSAAQLVHLSALRNLVQLRLDFVGVLDEEEDDFGDCRQLQRACSSFGGLLPLTHLEARRQELSAECLARMAAATHLTHLLLQRCTAERGTTIEQLVAMMQLPRLQLCGVDACDLSNMPPAAAKARARAAVAAPHLPAAPVQVLALRGCRLSNRDVLAIIKRLPGLQRLFLGGNGAVTDACLAGIAKYTPQLTYLTLSCYADVSDEAVAALCSALPQLVVDLDPDDDYEDDGWD